MSDQRTSLIPPALVPSGVDDDRQQAMAQAFGEMLAEFDFEALPIADPLTVDARLLPFLIRAFGAQDFIDPDLPEHVQRRILKNIWPLKALHGYNAGVKFGLSLLGMTAAIEHWWQAEPKRQANTHRITVEIDELLFPDDGGHFSDKQVAAIWRMINATKRQSQETEIRTGVTARGEAFMGAYVGTIVKATAPAVVPPPPVLNVTTRRAVVSTVLISATAGGHS